jgi:hypothetical protein
MIFSLIALLLLAASTLAQEYQNTLISAPTPGQKIKANGSFKVTLTSPVEFLFKNLISLI